MHIYGCLQGGLRSVVLAGVVLALGASAAPASMISLAFENTGNAQLVIDRADSGGGVGTFSFANSTIAPGTGSDFLITTPGDAALLYGNIDGTFTIGTITDNGLTPGTPGYTEIAPVTGTGTFAIHDGSGFDLSGSISFSTISTGAGPGLSLGTISSGGGIAISSLTYGGSNPLLQQLAGIGDASAIISFMFSDSALSLQSLTGGSGTTLASYVGALSAVSTDVSPDDTGDTGGGPVLQNPEPASMVLFGMGLLSCCAAPAMRRRRAAAVQS
jgi:hypothetical protein